MKIVLILSTIILPLIFYYLKVKIPFAQSTLNILAVISLTIFGMISSTSVYQVIVDDAVFSMQIHGLFLNPLFIISASYLGIYFIYRLLLLAVRELQSQTNY